MDKVNTKSLIERLRDHLACYWKEGDVAPRAVAAAPCMLAVCEGHTIGAAAASYAAAPPPASKHGGGGGVHVQLLPAHHFLDGPVQLPSLPCLRRMILRLNLRTAGVQGESSHK